MAARGLAAITTVLGAMLSSGAYAYPGGTPDFQTDVAPFCAACHSSVDVQALEGAGPRAEKELVANKHLAPILQGERPYDKLAPVDRTTLARQIQAIDANSTIEFVDYPPQVKSGENFNVTLRVSGGAGIALIRGEVGCAERDAAPDEVQDESSDELVDEAGPRGARDARGPMVQRL